MDRSFPPFAFSMPIRDSLLVHDDKRWYDDDIQVDDETTTLLLGLSLIIKHAYARNESIECKMTRSKRIAKNKLISRKSHFM